MLTTLQQQLSAFWKGQQVTQKITMIVLIVAALIIVPSLIVWAASPSYSVAFSGLSESDAGEIVQHLDESNIPYKIKNSGTIMVPSDQVYEARLKMATDGLPQSSTVGFEIFSGTTLGMTDFTQKVNYQRALEGELERTISDLDTVDAVRVHIVTPEKSLLSGDQAPTTASITIKPNSVNQLNSAQVRSITHLVASSVEGLQPDNVVVVDTNGNLLAQGTGTNGESASLAQVDSHRAAEVIAAQDLQNKLQAILDSSLGPDKSIVQASVTLDWTQKETTSQTYEPSTDTIRSSQIVSEAYVLSDDTTAGIPGAEANLPGGEAAETGAEGTGTLYQHSEETINYEVNQTQSHEILTPGDIKRISLSVMVDGITDEAQIATIESVIAAAAGLDTTRGDVLAVESFDFDRSYYAQVEEDLAVSEKKGSYRMYGEIAAVIVALALVFWYIQRLFKKMKLMSDKSWTPVMKKVDELQLAGGGIPANIQSSAGLNAGVLNQGSIASPAKMSPMNNPNIQSAVSKLSSENPENIANVIQSWISEES